MKEKDEIQFLLARTKEDYEIAKNLFREYAAHIRTDLCFQGFEKELQEISLQYGPPKGAIILCKKENEIIGCAGIRKINLETAELKRMYIKPIFHGKGWGKELLERSLYLAKELGYSKIRLDTLPFMKAAQTLYRQQGFYEVTPYYSNPVNGVLYMEKIL